MKKPVIIIAVIILVAGAAAFLTMKKPSVPADKASSETMQTLPGDAATSIPAETGGGMISSIKDAMGLGKKMKCTYSDPSKTGVVSTIYIDGQKTKFSSVVNGETVSGIFDGTTQYTWMTGKTVQGFKMDKACMDEMKDFAAKMPQGEITPTPTSEDIASLETRASNVSCEPAESEDFSIPSDITFTDQCEMLRGSMKALEQMKSSMPAGTDIPVRY